MTKNLLAFAICGSGVAAIVVIAAALIGDSRIYLVIQQNPATLSLPAIIGAAVGAATGFIRANK